MEIWQTAGRYEREFSEVKDSGAWHELCPSSFPGCFIGPGREMSPRWDSCRGSLSALPPAASPSPSLPSSGSAELLLSLL